MLKVTVYVLVAILPKLLPRKNESRTVDNDDDQDDQLPDSGQEVERPEGQGGESQVDGPQAVPPDTRGDNQAIIRLLEQGEKVKV